MDLTEKEKEDALNYVEVDDADKTKNSDPINLDVEKHKLDEEDDKHVGDDHPIDQEDQYYPEGSYDEHRNYSEYYNEEIIEDTVIIYNQDDDHSLGKQSPKKSRKLRSISRSRSKLRGKRRSRSPTRRSCKSSSLLRSRSCSSSHFTKRSKSRKNRKIDQDQGPEWRLELAGRHSTPLLPIDHGQWKMI